MDHQSDILIQLLLRFERLSFNGIGTIYLIRKPAAFENHRSLLSPPSELLAFSEQADKNFDLNILASRFRPEDKHFQQIAATLSNQLADMILSEGRTDLSGIGNIVKTPTGFMFTPAAEKFDGQFWGLPVLEVSAVPLNHLRNNSGESILAKDIQPPHFREEKQPNSYFIWPLAAIFLTIALLGLRYLNCSPEKYQDKPAAVPQTEFPTDSTKETVPAGTSNEYAENPVNSADSSLKAAVGDTLDIKAFDGECIIIVGSFSRKSNAERMMKRVSEAGYKAYLGKNNGMVRVGMTFECNREDLTDSMKSMRGKFTKDAWYLKPEVRIEK